MACCSYFTMLHNAYWLPGRFTVALHFYKKWCLLHQNTCAGVRNISVTAKLFASNSHIQHDVSSLESDLPVHTQYHSGDSESGEESHRHEQNIKDKILAASLPFVHMHGWTRRALSAGAESVGYAGVAHGLFPKEGAELVQYFCTMCNSQLAEKLKKETEQEEYKQKETRIFIKDAVEMRLRMIIPYMDKWSQALAIQSLPPNVPESLANLLTLVDDIWYYAGDKSADFNWYSQRIGLAGLYKMTELYLIQDKSEDYRNTWQFLSHRSDDVAYFHSYVQQSSNVSQMAKEAATAAFITARNILGLSIGNR